MSEGNGKPQDSVDALIRVPGNADVGGSNQVITFFETDADPVNTASLPLKVSTAGGNDIMINSKTSTTADLEAMALASCHEALQSDSTAVTSDGIPTATATELHSYEQDENHIFGESLEDANNVERSRKSAPPSMEYMSFPPLSPVDQGDIPTPNKPQEGCLSIQSCDDESAYLWLKKPHPGITTLDLANGSITTLECLQHPQWKTLETLVLDYNNIEEIRKCPPLPALTALSLNGNNIDELDDLLDDITNKFPRLRFLSLLDNPCCPALHTGTACTSLAIDYYANDYEMLHLSFNAVRCFHSLSRRSFENRAVTICSCQIWSAAWPLRTTL
eukprot:m.518687 g.518687  ORF g.518687 m.518687 type:complete len:332 (+) comp21942_c0_seq1:369-1364(+)